MDKFLYKIKEKKAQGLVEMAIVLPIIVLCIGIIITAGQLIFAKMTVQQAAYEGARRAVVISNYNTAKNTATAKSKEVMKNAIGVNQNSVSVSFGSSSAAWKKPNNLTYRVSADVRTLFPVIDSNLKTNTTTRVTGSIAMMIERNE